MASLFDALLRKQLYLESVKRGERPAIDQAVEDIFDVHIKRFNQLEGDTLGGISKREVLSILKELKDRATSIYARYTVDFFKFLQKLVSTETSMVALLIKQTATGLKKNPALSFFNRKYAARMWASIENSFLPSSGHALKTYIDGFGEGIIQKIANTFRQAVVNNDTLKDLLKVFTGTRTKMPDGSTVVKGSMINNTVNQGRAMTNTAIQHVASQTSDGVQSQFATKYIWISVIDERTGAICFALNGETFEYGKGPLPPAHTSCRSHTMPDTGEGVPKPPTFDKWLQEQPKNVQDEAKTDRQISLADYEQFVGNMLA